MQQAAWETAALACLRGCPPDVLSTCLQCFDTSEALNSPLRAGTQFPHEAATKQDTPTWSKATCSYRSGRAGFAWSMQQHTNASWAAMTDYGVPIDQELFVNRCQTK